jgi:hypothetical protein
MPERLSGMPEQTREGTSAGMHVPSVRVRTEFISAGMSDTHRVTLPPEVPVGTMGVMQARAELTPAAESPLAVTDTLARGLLVGLKTHPLPELALAATRPVTNEVVEEIPPAAPLAPAARVDNAPRDASSVASVSPAVDRSAELRRDEEGVLRVLHDYTRAYERLDVQATKAIYPSVNDRALQRAFEQLDGQQLRFASCDLSFTGHDANARCRGEATYRPKVGSRVLRITEGEWTFNLSRANDTWQIVKATLQ